MRKYRPFAGSARQNPSLPGRAAAGQYADPQGRFQIAVLGEGSRAPESFRSSEGAGMAVQAGLVVLQRFLEEWCGMPEQERNLSAGVQGYARRIGKEIEADWRSQVSADLASRPIGRQELRGIPVMSAAAYQIGRDLEKCYCSSILAAAICPEFFLILQIGEGRIIALYPGDRRAAPWPSRKDGAQVKLLGEEGLLSAPGAFRCGFTADLPTAALLACGRSFAEMDFADFSSVSGNVIQALSAAGSSGEASRELEERLVQSYPAEDVAMAGFVLSEEKTAEGAVQSGETEASASASASVSASASSSAAASASASSTASASSAVSSAVNRELLRKKADLATAQEKAELARQRVQEKKKAIADALERNQEILQEISRLQREQEQLASSMMTRQKELDAAERELGRCSARCAQLQAEVAREESSPFSEPVVSDVEDEPTRVAEPRRRAADAGPDMIRPERSEERQEQKAESAAESHTEAGEVTDLTEDLSEAAAAASAASAASATVTTSSSVSVSSSSTSASAKAQSSTSAAASAPAHAQEHRKPAGRRNPMFAREGDFLN